MKRALAVLAFALIAACSNDATAPANALANALGSPFTLKLYNGANLPTYIDEAFGYCGPLVVGATLAAAGDGRITFSQSSNSNCTPGAAATVSTRAGSVVVDGSIVTITLDADGTNVSGVYVGTLANDVLTLNHQIDYGPRQLNQFYTFVRP